MQTDKQTICDNLQAAHIIAVDDRVDNLELVQQLLSSQGYTHITLVSNPAQVVDIYRQQSADLFLIDLNMPVMDGFTLMQTLLDLEDEFLPPMLVLTAQTDSEFHRRALNMGARDYINKPFDFIELLARVRNQLEVRQGQLLLRNQNEVLEERVKLRTSELKKAHEKLHDSRLQVVRRLGRAAEYRDNETGLHILRMSYLSVLLGRLAGMSEHEQDLLLNASPMHDIGKIGVPDRVLLKPGGFEADEWEIMKRHTLIGADILSGDDTPMLAMARQIALTHHEKWDGSGYPYGLKGESIPLCGRITALADVFDALTSERPYKKAWPVEEAVEYIQQHAGSHFDPGLVQLFVDNLESVIEIKQRFVEPVADVG